ARVEVRLGHAPPGAALRLVIRVDLGHAAQGLLDGLERQHPAAHVHPARKSRVLNDDWTAACQVAGAPLAEPSGVTGDVAVLGDAELRFRLPDVPLKRREVARGRLRIPHVPTVAYQLLARNVWSTDG